MNSADIEALSSNEPRAIQTDYFDKDRIRHSRKSMMSRKYLPDALQGVKVHYEVFSSVTISPDKDLISHAKELLQVFSMSQKDLADVLGVK